MVKDRRATIEKNFWLKTYVETEIMTTFYSWTKKPMKIMLQRVRSNDGPDNAVQESSENA